jgi:transcriptional regulator with GAF, ATPase, and Fis domain
MTRSSRLEQGRVALRSGAVDAAVPLLEGALEAASAAGDRALEAEARVELARAFRARGAVDRAFLQAEQAAEAARASALPALLADARLLEAELLRGLGEAHGASAKVRQAVDLLEDAASQARAAGQFERACDFFERAGRARPLLVAGDVAPAAGARRDDDARRRERALVVALYETSRRIVEERDPAKVVSYVLDGAIEALSAERGFVLIVGEGDGDLPGGLSVAAARDFDRAEIKKAEFKVSRGVIEKALATRSPILVRDASSDPDLSGRASVLSHKLRSLVCVPFEMRSVKGALYLDNRFAEGAFGEGDLPALSAFAAHAATALENARLHAEAARRNADLEAARARATELAHRLEDELNRTGEELARAQIEKTQARAGMGDLVGSSRAMQAVYKLIDKIKEADVPVLVRGESGTGKELVARAIHFEGPRRSLPFVSENCAALPETLLESVLFGHEPGAFTGALGRKPGLFELAGEGTLFLDEVGELSPGSQAKLLRVLQEKAVRRVGGDREFPVRARILAATNRDLEAMVRDGVFREDLYYRLAVVTLKLPPLRERKTDIPAILMRLTTLSFTKPALKKLVDYSWPGNIRELWNELKRLEAVGVGRVGVDQLELGREAVAAGALLPPRTLQDLERTALVQALRRAAGNKAKAADMLGIPRGSLWHRVRRYRIQDAEWHG